MVSLRYRFLFVHLPKTGGNSVQDVLRPFSEDRIVTLKDHQDGVDRFGIESQVDGLTKHATLAEYRAAMPKDQYRGLFKFATIRNPWDRMISWYFSPHRGEVEWDRGRFVEMVEQAATLLDHVSERPRLARVMFALGLRRLDADLDALLRFESLSDDFEAVCARLGLEASALPHRNRGSRASYERYYDDGLIELVARRFAPEVRAGGYRFGA
jgi:hypothetical protein